MLPSVPGAGLEAVHGRPFGLISQLSLLSVAMRRVTLWRGTLLLMSAFHLPDGTVALASTAAAPVGQEMRMGVK